MNLTIYYEVMRIRPIQRKNVNIPENTKMSVEMIQHGLVTMERKKYSISNFSFISASRHRL